MLRYLAFLILYIPFYASAQLIEGVVTEQNTGTPLAFVNIGILSKGTGTVSQQDGSFRIDIPAEFDIDTVQFSMLGYATKKIIVRDLRQQMQNNGGNIMLQQKNIELQDVLITPKRIKTDKLGNSYDSRSITARFTSEKLGCELATLMNGKANRQYYLKTAGITINMCTYDSIIFRLNIYSYADGMPGTLLNRQPIYVIMHKEDREIKIDLLPYNITASGDFVISLEWIEDVEGSHNNVGFCAGFFGAKLFYKDTSMDSWQKAPANIGVGMYCIADYEK